MDEKAPDFTLIDQNGEPFNLYQNLDKPVMLVFYPRDKSPVCTKQLCSYNEELEKFTKAGIQIIGINIENEESHKRFAKEFNFRFPLLSDKDKKVSKAYNALNFAGMNRRKIVIISIDGNIVFTHSIFPAFYQKSEELLDIIRKNKYL